ncbi:MAG TPA: hypothetical protein VHB69_00580 [Mycobacteriales bacterium]|jgi:hypothetical protein|nr:hypothetical protein [Mycobacteriales bacterium]
MDLPDHLPTLPGERITLKSWQKVGHRRRDMYMYSRLKPLAE